MSTDFTYSMIVILIVILVTVILIVIIVVVIVMIITIMIVLGIETVYGLVIKTGCGYPSAAVHARVSSALTRHMPLQAFCGERASCLLFAGEPRDVPFLNPKPHFGTYLRA